MATMPYRKNSCSTGRFTANGFVPDGGKQPKRFDERDYRQPSEPGPGAKLMYLLCVLVLLSMPILIAIAVGLTEGYITLSF